MDIWDVEQPATENRNAPKADKVIVLTTAQKTLISNRWKNDAKTPPSIQELLDIAFPKQNLDGRSKEATAVKEFLVSCGINSEPSYKPKRNFELSIEHKEYLKNNYSTMRPIEMARALFGNNISPGSSEVKEISGFLRTLDKKPMYGEEIESSYSPPRSLDRLVSRLKKYIDEVKGWDNKNLTPTQKKQSESLIGYLASYRFKHQIDSYESQVDKELFESSFIKYCYDKNDLSQENCDQYILLCSEVIILAHIQETINMLQREQNRVLEEEGKISMAVVEAIKTARQEHNDCIKRQQALYKSLTQERSDKLSEEIKDKASLLNLVNLWKNEASRKEMIKIANDRKDKLKGEIERMETMEDLKIKIIGISRNEILEN